jgi:hypothetical protein
VSNENEVATAGDAALLDPGQWCADATGEFYCLVDTHLGFPQRMAMSKGGRGFTALDNLTYPLHLADFQGVCNHEWGANEMGHCRRCGQVAHPAHPTTFNDEQMRVFRQAAEHNARADRAQHINQEDGTMP